MQTQLHEETEYQALEAALDSVLLESQSSDLKTILSESFDSAPYAIIDRVEKSGETSFIFSDEVGDTYRLQFIASAKFGKNIDMVYIGKGKGRIFADKIDSLKNPQKMIATMISVFQEYILSPRGMSKNGFAINLSGKAAVRFAPFLTKLIGRTLKQKLSLVKGYQPDSNRVFLWAHKSTMKSEDVFNGKVIDDTFIHGSKENQSTAATPNKAEEKDAKALNKVVSDVWLVMLKDAINDLASKQLSDSIKNSIYPLNLGFKNYVITAAVEKAERLNDGIVVAKVYALVRKLKGSTPQKEVKRKLAIEQKDFNSPIRSQAVIRYVEEIINDIKNELIAEEALFAKRKVIYAKQPHHVFYAQFQDDLNFPPSVKRVIKDNTKSEMETIPMSDIINKVNLEDLLTATSFVMGKSTVEKIVADSALVVMGDHPEFFTHERSFQRTVEILQSYDFKKMLFAMATFEEAAREASNQANNNRVIEALNSAREALKIFQFKVDDHTRVGEVAADNLKRIHADYGHIKKIIRARLSGTEETIRTPKFTGGVAETNPLERLRTMETYREIEAIIDRAFLASFSSEGHLISNDTSNPDRYELSKLVREATIRARVSSIDKAPNGGVKVFVDTTYFPKVGQAPRGKAVSFVIKKDELGDVPESTGLMRMVEEEKMFLINHIKKEMKNSKKEPDLGSNDDIILSVSTKQGVLLNFSKSEIDDQIKNIDAYWEVDNLTKWIQTAIENSSKMNIAKKTLEKHVIKVLRVLSKGSFERLGFIRNYRGEIIGLPNEVISAAGITDIVASKEQTKPSVRVSDEQSIVNPDDLEIIRYGDQKYMEVYRSKNFLYHNPKYPIGTKIQGHTVITQYRVKTRPDEISQELKKMIDSEISKGSELVMITYAPGRNQDWKSKLFKTGGGVVAYLAKKETVAKSSLVSGNVASETSSKFSEVVKKSSGVVKKPDVEYSQIKNPNNMRELGAAGFIEKDDYRVGELIDWYDHETGDKHEYKVVSANSKTVKLKRYVGGKPEKTYEYRVA